MSSIGLAPLDNFQIDRFFTSLTNGKRCPKYYGCVLQDELRDMTPEDGKFYVVNFLRTTDPPSEVGHWVLVWNVRDQFILYVDPFGKNPPEDILSFMKRARRKNGDRKERIISTTDIQNYDSDFCGHFVIMLAKRMLRGQSFITTLANMDLLRTKLNDEFIRRLKRKKYFQSYK